MFFQALVRILYIFFLQYPTKILLAELLFCFSAKRRKHFWWRFIPCVLIFLALPFCFGYYDSWMMIGGWYSLSFLMHFILSIALILFCFQFSWKQAVFYCSSAYAVEHCFDCLQRIANRLFQAQEIHLDIYCRLALYLGIMVVTFAFFYFIFIRKIRNLDDSVIKNNLVIFMSVTTILVTNVMSVWIGHVGYDIYHKIYDAIACVLLIMSYYMFFYIFELVKKNEVLKCVLDMNEEQRLIAKENIELINIKCHDIKHQIENLRCLTNSEEMQQNLQELEKFVGIYDSILKTGNSTLDAVLTEKKLFCERYKINFSCIIDGCTLGFMEDEDIYALFGNALDNAVECVIKNEEEMQRLISIKVSPVGKMLSIHFDNYCANEIVWKDGLPMTGKGDRASHGYGMRSIRHVVDKYQGTMTVFQKDNMFNLNIVLPIPEEKGKKE